MIREQGMPSRRFHHFGNLYIQFDIKFPERLTGPDGQSAMTPQQCQALASVLPARAPGPAPPRDAMSEDFQLEDVDPNREGARAQGATMVDDEDEEMGAGGERVQCASQ